MARPAGWDPWLVGALGLTPADLADDVDYRAPQALAAAAMAAGAEALLVPSVTGLGDNLIVFTARRSGSVAAPPGPWARAGSGTRAIRATRSRCTRIAAPTSMP
jgi:RES domain